MPDATATLDGVRQQFQQQVDFFRAKLNLPSERWDSIERAAHDRGFIVAGAMKADLLADLRRAVDDAVQGGSWGAFHKEFLSTAEKHGWIGWTGQGTQRGQAWRTRVVYQTNVATSYAAGRWQQLHDPELLARRPFWRYVHNDNAASPRPQHKAWGDAQLTLRHDHPFWSTHFPPNGWGCGCRVVAVRAPSEDDATEPPPDWDAINPKTGTPAGIDKGWDYAPGAQADDELRSFVQSKLIGYPPAIEKAFRAELKKAVDATSSAPQFARDALAHKERAPDLWIGFVEKPGQIERITGIDARGYLQLLPADGVRHVQGEHGFDGGTQRPPTPEDYALLPEILNEADSLSPGSRSSAQGAPRIVATKAINAETYQAVFEVRSGKRNRALALISLWIKTR